MTHMLAVASLNVVLCGGPEGTHCRQKELHAANKKLLAPEKSCTLQAKNQNVGKKGLTGCVRMSSLSLLCC